MADRLGGSSRASAAIVTDRVYQRKIARFARHSLSALAIAGSDQLAHPFAQASRFGGGALGIGLAASLGGQARVVDASPVQPETTDGGGSGIGRLGQSGGRQKSGGDDSEATDHAKAAIAEEVSIR